MGYNRKEHESAIQSGDNPGTKVSTNDKFDKETPYKENPVEASGGEADFIPVALHDRAFGGASTDSNKERTAALESLAKYTSIDSVSKTLHIRGHSGLLQQCFNPGDTFGTTMGIWLKLNIWSRDDETGQRDKYFYDGVYNVVTIDHIFNDGKFTQEMNLLMMNFDQLKEVT